MSDFTDVVFVSEVCCHDHGLYDHRRPVARL